MPASLYGAGNYGAGLYSADPLQEAAVTWGVKVALQANASFLRFLFLLNSFVELYSLEYSSSKGRNLGTNFPTSFTP